MLNPCQEKNDTSGKNFVERLLSFRQPGETQDKFAQRLGLSQGQLNRYLNDKYRPRRDVGERLAAILNVPMAWLLYGEGEAHEVRRAGARAGEKLADHDKMEMACSWIADLEGLDREERERLQEFLRDGLLRPDRLAEALDLYSVLKQRRKP